MTPEHLFHDAKEPMVGRRAIAWQCMGAICLFLAALLTTAVAGRNLILRASEFSPGEVLTEKLNILRESSDDYDVFFIGTSHIYRSIDPDIFDQVCSQKGLDVHSYNAGVFRLGILEAEDLIRTIVDNRTAERPWFVVMEPSLRDCDFSNWTSERELYSHHWHHTRAAVQRHWQGMLDRQSPMLMIRHFAALVGHFGSGLVNQLNYGLASSATFPDGNRFSTRTYSKPASDGFLPLDKESARRRSGRRSPPAMSTDDFQKYLQKGTADRKKLTRQPMLSSVRYYKDLITTIESAGGQVLFVATPRISPGAPLYGDDLEALFNSPPPEVSNRLLADYRFSGDESDLFQAENWFDPEHLNLQGAQSFSRRLAADFAARMPSISFPSTGRTEAQP